MERGNDAQGANKPVIDMERLVEMANQIGDFFSPYPPARGAEGLRNHLRTYWDPRMRAALLAHIDAGGEELSEIVIAGAKLLRDEKAEKDGYYGPPKA
ncbi:MAG: formate dehydrogenase subunit delta, partial [Gammaproteobacteria bacterium]|nr:formate dehydrogenase subunit delta [Gammaproteobacteria bacterium]